MPCRFDGDAPILSSLDVTMLESSGVGAYKQYKRKAQSGNDDDDDDKRKMMMVTIITKIKLITMKLIIIIEIINFFF